MNEQDLTKRRIKVCGACNQPRPSAAWSTRTGVSICEDCLVETVVASKLPHQPRPKIVFQREANGADWQEARSMDESA